MPGGGVVFSSTPTDVDRIEAPMTWKAYLICAFGAFGGLLFGFDSGYINGVLGMPYFIHQFTGLPYPDIGAPSGYFVIPAWRQSLIVSVLSAGTFFGSLLAGDFADFFGRRIAIILGCGIFCIGVALQVASTAYGLLIAGRLVSGLGVGFTSSIVILYMSEIAPRKFRGTIVAGYEFCITLGILLASCIVYGTQNLTTSASYRIPIAIQCVWALILGLGLFFLPESPRYYVKKDQLEKAAQSLAIVRGQCESSEYIIQEIADIVANYEYEKMAIPQSGYLSSWANCFKGSIFVPSSNLRRTIFGTSAQMMQQWTGINFIFYFGTAFFQQLGSIKNPFLISLITTLVNVCSTPFALWAIERYGRRPLLIYGALGMVVCQFIIAIAGTIDGKNPATVRAEIAFICFYIFFFATTWGPVAWVVVGETFPLPIRSRGVALSTASNWLWNCIIAVITPYMVGPDKGNLGAKVFFVWGALCIGCLVWAYFLVFETKGLSLEQIDRMLEETTPRTSSKWVPATTFSHEVDLSNKEDIDGNVLMVEEVHGKKSVV